MKFRKVDLREDCESLGWTGGCMHEGCDKIAWYVMAEDAKPECVCGNGCDHGNAALAYYCAKHIDGPRVADREHVEEQLWRDVETCTRTWHVLLAAYPSPLPLAVTVELVE
jgi:hypothetical protein